MRLSTTAQVGVTVLVAAALLVFATFSLRGAVKRGTYVAHISFLDAQGLQDGASVRVRGVEKGWVDSIDLGADNRAVVTLRIRNRYRIQPKDSIRVISSLAGLSPTYVEITPGGRKEAAVVAPGEPIPGEESTSSEKLINQSDQLLQNLNDLTVRMTRLTENLALVAGDPQLRKNFQQVAGDFSKITRSGVVIAQNMESATGRADRLINSFQGTAAQLDRTMRQVGPVLSGLRETAEQSGKLMKETRGLVGETRSVVKDSGELVRATSTAVRNAGGLVTDTRAALAENRDRVKALFDNLNDSLQRLDATLKEARSLLGDEKLRGDFTATAGNIREATENLKKITADVRGLTGDPKVQEDLKATLANLRDATEQAGEVFRRTRDVLGTGGKAAKSIGQRLSEAKIDVEALRGTRTDRNRLDLDATFPWSNTTYYRAGFFDFGESNKFNLQAGRQLRPGVAARFGFHASKLGFGLDFGGWRRPPFSVDLFGVDLPRVDLRANLPIASYLDLTVGLDNATRRADPILGLRYRK